MAMFLSDVHMDVINQDLEGVAVEDVEGRLTTTRFKFHDPTTEQNEFNQKRETTNNVEKERPNEVCYIQHRMQTSLEDVGLQVWNGAIYMCDYILHESNLFKEKKVLELGAGTGLVSIVLSLFAKHVVCSDRDDCIVQMARLNFDLNSHLFSPNSTSSCVVINWANTQILPWTDISGVDIVVACDVAYDCDLSDLFIDCLTEICLRTVAENNSVLILISIEKRVLFCAEDSKPSTPNYSYFVDCLEEVFVSRLKDEKMIVHIDYPNCSVIPRYFSTDKSRPSTMQMIVVNVSMK